MRGIHAVVLLFAAVAYAQPPVVVASNGRFLQTADGKPFFWLGDTAWLLSQKLDRNAAERYLEDRRAKGFNVIQCSILHARLVKIRQPSENQNPAMIVLLANPYRPKTRTW